MNPRKETIAYAKTILETHDASNSHDVVRLAKDLEKRGLVVSDEIFYVCWEIVNPYSEAIESCHTSFTSMFSAISYMKAIKCDNKFAKNVRLARSVNVVWDESEVENIEDTSVPVEIASDGRCKCSCSTPCPLGKSGSEYRCTKEELEAAGIETIEDK